MQLSDKAIAEFQALYSKHFHATLPTEQAESEALRLIRLVALIQRQENVLIASKPTDPEDNITVEYLGR